MLPFAFVTVDFLRIVRYIAGRSKKMSIVSIICKFYFEHSTTFFHEMFFLQFSTVPLNLLRILKKSLKDNYNICNTYCAISIFFPILKYYSFTYYTKNASYVTYNLRYCCSIIYTKSPKGYEKRQWNFKGKRKLVFVEFGI